MKNNCEIMPCCMSLFASVERTLTLFTVNWCATLSYCHISTNLSLSASLSVGGNVSLKTSERICFKLMCTCLFFFRGQLSQIQFSACACKKLSFEHYSEICINSYHLISFEVFVNLSLKLWRKDNERFLKETLTRLLSLAIKSNM